MTQRKQPVRRNARKRDRLATLGCNTACDHDGMVDYDEVRMAEALAELDALTAVFKNAEDALNKAREAVQEAIVRHLREQNAPPGKVAEHSPYDRNHVGRLAKAAEVPSLRPATVKPIKAKRK